MFLPTVKIKFGDGWVNINERDFDSKTQELWVDDVDPKPNPEPEQPTKESRRLELEAMGWREIKSISESFDPTIEKGDDQNWDDVIPEILAREFPD